MIASQLFGCISIRCQIALDEPKLSVTRCIEYGLNSADLLLDLDLCGLLFQHEVFYSGGS
jgi:hypothetical protein